MSEMQVGDIGVLQNLTPPMKTAGNGNIAEVVDIFRKPVFVNQLNKKLCGYKVRDLSGNGLRGFIFFDQIRPLSDPDKQETETEQAVEV